MDDIVTRLRSRALLLFCNGADGNAFLDDHAADEIERLRTAGDILDNAIRTGIGIDDALDGWEEIRRG